MPLPALLLTIATLLPLASFVVLVFWGKRLGNPLAGYIGTAAIGAGFVCSVLAMFAWFGHSHGREWGAGIAPINMPVQWLPTGEVTAPAGDVFTPPKAGYMDLGIYVDSLTITMFMMVTLVATLVHIFSIGYMHEDERFPRFFTYLGLFCFSMLGLVLGGTILHLFVFWELVGLCSYLLIGFWYEKKSASNAAIKAFVANRVGDFGFLIGFGVLFYHVGNATLPSLWTMLSGAGAGGAVTLPDGTFFGAGALTVMGVGLFCGAIGKSAQFPLHVWLPDAMEGPTPVSALIHAATMVAAGVYLVGRIFPILTPDAKLVIATIGLITLTMAALIALAQSDIKKVLAYSTVSQLGFMVLAMGVGAWMAGLFHLITHAFFKALLFLGSGSVIYAAHHEQEMPQYGGLLKKIPVTAITFGIGVLAIAGTPYLSGYLSKDHILIGAAIFAAAKAETTGGHWYWIYFALPSAVAYLTAFYMMRCWTLTFAGKPRNHHVHDHAHEAPVMWWPLVVLAALSIGGGYVFVPSMLRNTMAETRNYCKVDAFKTANSHRLTPAEPEFQVKEHGAETAVVGENVEAGDEKALEHAEHMVQTWVYLAFAFGIVGGYLLYRKGYYYTDKMMQFALFRAMHTFLRRKMFFDELYNFLFVGGVRTISVICGAFDKYVVDGVVNLVGHLTKAFSFLAGVNDKYVVDGAVLGSGQLAWGIGSLARGAQTGRVRGYVTLMLLVLAAGLLTVMAFYLA